VETAKSFKDILEHFPGTEHAKLADFLAQIRQFDLDKVLLESSPEHLYYLDDEDYVIVSEGTTIDCY
jgi:hypothetical protein